MATYCQVTGRKPQFGKTVSHSHKRTSRRFNPNLQTKRYYVPSLKRTVTITVSTKGIKTIDSRGIESVVADLIRSGEL
ncbi:50S ribosomal protein L28 [Arcanobacterium buesumense]|uniref:Large ribosomal subunit protein bL28 n=1 Tax=Arcanobacterium buesumense TaxID=2722751 RepID=A0A6H2EIX7_9ACTO|nr:50S ribosomal protein L28 [Arcanobacterium buesumense]QJC21518.1 50S ribosomal protein L28 [Arcanobacterium buesumense]